VGTEKEGKLGRETVENRFTWVRSVGKIVFSSNFHAEV
jgi:hypothetical protein